MKRIPDIRAALQAIDGVFYELPPEEARRGKQAALQTLWWPELDGPGDPVERTNDAVQEAEADDGAAPAVEEIFEIAPEIDLDRAVSALGGTEQERLRQAQLQHGVDGLAWYMTFHATNAQWGIYVPVTSLISVANDVFGPLPASSDTKLRLAFRALHQHEMFHFAVDLMTAQWEGLLGRPCHKPARSLRDATLGFIPLEEECANAHMLRSFIWGGKSSLRVTGKTATLRAFVKQQPIGYKDALLSTGRRVFEARCADLIRAYIGRISGYTPPALEAVDLLRFLTTGPALDWRYCPIHIIHDGQRLDIPVDLLGLFRAIATIVETETFLKQLNRLPSQYVRAWANAKARLQISTMGAGLDFKFWERTRTGTRYSIRISQSHRVHLEHRPAEKQWFAVAAGPHTAMGHG